MKRTITYGLEDTGLTFSYTEGDQSFIIQDPTWKSETAGESILYVLEAGTLFDMVAALTEIAKQIQEGQER